MAGKSKFTGDAAGQAALRDLSKSELQLLRHWFISGNGFSYRNPYETSQLAISKFLLFAILDYLVLFCARNFLSHKHNTIVNKHRPERIIDVQCSWRSSWKGANGM